MGRLRRFRRIGGRLVPLYPNWVNPDWDGNPQKGIEGAALRRDGQPVDPKAANELAAKIAKERKERIEKQGHA